MRTKLSALGLLILLVLASPPAWCQTLRWETNLPEAARQAAASNRLVLVHFWAPWCVACRKMEQEIFSQPDVQAAIDADYVAVQLNVDHNRPVAQQYGIT
ncbi:MAG: thioredoxin family protein, partial [Pirellulales bacterium]|nr:thioredoxin family protein [Pirellulales bacterium]